jgi:flagellar hook-length control protein FliK
VNALASIVPPAAATTAAAPLRADSDDADKPSAFAQCMAQAQQQTQAAPSNDEESAGDDASAQDDAPAADPAAAPPDLAALLPGWSAAPVAAAGQPAVARPTKAEDDAPLALDAKEPRATQPSAAALGADAPGTLAAQPPAPSSAAPERSADFALPTSAREATARAASEPRMTAPDNALAPLPPVATPAPPPRASDPATPTAHVPAPMHTPDFAPALATQVRWWAQDGVQQAQLTLNPPEMGPVTVKIVLHEQREARIDFIADVPATRSALEAALPVLAAALDESGLKLAGGGVHDGAAQRQALWQHAQQQPQSTLRGAAALASGQSFTATDGHAAAVAPPTRGLVDLVA